MNLELSEFLKHRQNFSLGFLTTESFHPLTKNLSKQVKENLVEAIDTLVSVDKMALVKLKSYSQSIYKLQRKCQKIINQNNKIYISGCGATGRLALSLEKIFREKFNSDQVVGFMAGGDFALIKSVESFEDNKDYGKRQLEELGFSSGDLLIGITEGGETSFVIGSVEHAREVSSVCPHFVYCNPDDELVKIERSRNILEDKAIEKLNLTVGPMAISGSTRMQATTVQMLAVGFALLHDHKNFKEFEIDFHKFIENLGEVDYQSLKYFIEKEVSVYENSGLVHYKSDDHIALAILTDTTERSPTFNLRAFEKKDVKDFALCYLSVGDGDDDKKAWSDLLGRTPRDLHWRELDGIVSKEEIYKFDISKNSFERRKAINASVSLFEIFDKGHTISFSFEGKKMEFSLKQEDLFFKHMALKLMLNIHSTLMMGLMDRFIGNMMSYVRASNMKLIDRSIRYIQEILRQDGIDITDEDVAKLVFENLDGREGREGPIVKRVVDLVRD